MATELEEALTYKLANTAGVSALVSDRIYPGIAPQGAALPYLTYQRVSGPRTYTFDGASGIEAPRIQIDCFAATYSGVKALATAVRAALSALTGNIGDTGKQVLIRQCHLESDGDGYDITAGAERGPRRVTQDWFIWHTE